MDWLQSRENSDRVVSQGIYMITDPRTDSGWIELLNASFPVPAGKSFLEDFPVWGAAGPKHKLTLAVEREGTIAATASARITKVRLQRSTLTIGIIGAVCTRGGFQNQGLASMLVAELKKWCVTEGASFVVLWGSGAEALYEKQGFVEIGTQFHAPISSIVRPEDFVGLGSIARGWDDSIMKILAQRNRGLVLESDDLAWIGAHKNINWYRLGDAVAAFGKGIDLDGFVHEAHGTPRVLRRLLAAIANEHPGARILGPRSFMNRMGVAPEDRVGLALCLGAWVGTEEEFARFLSIETQSRVAFDRSTGTLVCRARATKPLSLSAVLRLVFGPDVFAGVETEDLPLPLWFYGIDSA